MNILPQLPLSPDRHPWMADTGMGLLPDPQLHPVLAEITRTGKGWRRLLEFVGHFAGGDAAAARARTWFGTLGLPGKTEGASGGLDMQEIGTLTGNRLFPSFSLYLTMLPEIEDPDEGMERDREIHQISEDIARLLLTDLRRAMEEVRAGQRGPAPAAPAAQDQAPKEAAAPRLEEVRPAPPRQAQAVTAPRVAPGKPANPEKTTHAGQPRSGEAGRRPAPAAAAVQRPSAMGGIVKAGFLGMRAAPAPADRVPGSVTDLIPFLPPPPSGGGLATNVAWAIGRPWSDHALGIETRLAQLHPDEMMELETDIHANFSNHSVRSPFPHHVPAGAGAGHAGILLAAGAALGSDPSRTHGARALSDAYERVIARILPETLPVLSALHARLVVPAGLNALATAVYDLAEERIGNGFGEGAQHFEGTINPCARVLPESAIDRAMFLHLAGGMPLPEALTEGLIELQWAHRIHRHPEMNVSLSEIENLFYDRHGGRPEKSRDAEKAEEPIDTDFGVPF